MSAWWLSKAKRMADYFQFLFTIFYYRKYFEWGLPARRFIQVNIETNTVCNRTCHFCLYGINDQVPANPMSATLFFNIIDQLAEMHFKGRLSLFSTNEPLTDKRIYDFIQYARLALPSCYHTLVSNGDLLNEEKLDRLFQSGLNLLLLNSYDEQALARNQKLYDYALQKFPGGILHTDRTTYVSWVSRAGHVQQYAKAPPVEGYCDLPNYALYINPLGQVLSCCHDFYADNLMGDLTRQSLKEAWYSQAFADLRKGLNKGDRSISKLCKGCDHQPNLEYFKWNDDAPVNASRQDPPWITKIPRADAIVQAQALKAHHIEREKQSREKLSQRKRTQAKVVSI